MDECHLLQLLNGIRVAYKQVSNTRVVHCGFMVNLGSRDEQDAEQGMAHFWEHMVFKGTTKRKPFHIINRLEVAGGELNAYTTKEKVCFYASVLEGHFEKAVELLCDITFNSIFPEKEIDKEKNVILEEMNMCLDTPEENIQDEFENLIFKSHPLGHNILGTSETISSFTREDFFKFLKNNLDTEKTVFSVVGNLPYHKVKKIVEKYLSDIPANTLPEKRESFTGYQPVHEEEVRSFFQVHCMLGRTAYSASDERRIPFFMLINLLGGPNMNSRLNLALREKFGYVYSVDAQYTPLSDCGIANIYFATEKRHFQRSMNIVLKELKKLREKPLGKVQLHTCKEQIKGQLAMAEESNLATMQRMARNLLDYERISDINSVFQKIDQVESKDLQAVAGEMLHEKDLSVLTYIPENGNN